MSKGEHYTIEHWSTATAERNYKNTPLIQVTVNDRAATRQAIINEFAKTSWNSSSDPIGRRTRTGQKGW